MGIWQQVPTPVPSPISVSVAVSVSVPWPIEHPIRSSASPIHLPPTQRAAHFTIFDFLIYGFNFLSNLPIDQHSLCLNPVPHPAGCTRIRLGLVPRLPTLASCCLHSFGCFIAWLLRFASLWFAAAAAAFAVAADVDPGRVAGHELNCERLGHLASRQLCSPTCAGISVRFNFQNWLQMLN